jgi:hypothetical protein
MAQRIVDAAARHVHTQRLRRQRQWWKFALKSFRTQIFLNFPANLQIFPDSDTNILHTNSAVNRTDAMPRRGWLSHNPILAAQRPGWGHNADT